MRKVKKILLMLLIILTILYVPSSVFAKNLDDEKIFNEAMNYMKYNTYIQQTNSTRAFNQLVKNYYTWRSEIIYLTRTAGSSGVTVEVENWGDHYVDVCIFSQETEQIIGTTKRVVGGQIGLLSWTNSEMYDNGETSKIFVFLTMYTRLYNPITVTVTY